MERERLESVARRADDLLDALDRAGGRRPEGGHGAWHVGAAKAELEAALAALRDQPCPACGAPDQVTLEEWGGGECCGACADDG